MWSYQRFSLWQGFVLVIAVKKDIGTSTLPEAVSVFGICLSQLKRNVNTIILDNVRGPQRNMSVLTYLLTYCFEPSQPQRITLGLNRNFSLTPRYSFHKSWYHKSSLCVCSFVCFYSLFIFRGHSTREPASNRVTYFILRAYTGSSLSHS